MPHARHFLVTLALLCCAPITFAQSPGPARVTTLHIAHDATTTPVAEVLQQRLTRRSPITVHTSGTPEWDTGLLILLHLPATAGKIAELAQSTGFTLPGTKTQTFAEGFTLKSFTHKKGQALLIAGAGARGLLYGAGELLRQLRHDPDALRIPNLDLQSAPAYRYRGFSTNQGGTMRKITGARAWTEAENAEDFLDYALAGANCFYTGREGGAFHDRVKAFGCMSITDARPNQHAAAFPEDWRAGGLEGWEGKDWVCPSIPEARAAVMAQWEADFPARAQHDIFRMYAGDPGGCRDERCAPWGKTFVHLCEDVAKIWLKSHPNTVVLIANQDLSNDGDAAIFDYLNAAPRPWLTGLAYGPGSNALSDYFRDEQREDLLQYPAHGWVNRYLAETLRALPKQQYIVHYSDITHWISAQYEVAHPEPNVVKAYGRRTFHARPKAFYDIFHAIMPFSEGDIIYSEGHHDEFHQYLWNRMLWNPQRSLDDLLSEYGTLYFGEEAAPLMAEALLQLESSLESPLDTNPGIDRYYGLVKDAGWKMPPHFRNNNYRWLLHMEKAALDKYNQLKLRQERNIENEVRRLVCAARDTGAYGALQSARNALATYKETEDMKLLREEARVCGEEADRLFGVRNPGFFKLDNSLRSLDSLIPLLDQALAATNRDTREQAFAKTLERIDAPTRPGNIFW